MARCSQQVVAVLLTHPSQSSGGLASFPGPAQLSIAIALLVCTVGDGKLGGARERGYWRSEKCFIIELHPQGRSKPTHLLSWNSIDLNYPVRVTKSCLQIVVVY